MSARPDQPTPTQLRQLLDASKLLHSTLELAPLLDRIIDIARDLVRADRATLYVVDHDAGELWTKTVAGPRIEAFRLPLGEGIAGHAAATGQASLLKDAHRSPRFNPAIERETGYRTRSLLTVPFRDRDGRVMGVLQGINHRRGEFHARERTLLRQLGEYVALALENAFYVEELREKKRMEEDLIAARRIQFNLLPRQLPQPPGVELAARYRPCLAVGGDCYDALVAANGSLYFSLGDVAGKGLTAAMMMSNLQALFRAEARRGRPLAELLGWMNELFHESTEAHQFATFCAGRLEPATGRLQLGLAGHDPALLRRADGTVEEAGRGGLMLGVMPGFEFPVVELELAPGDMLLLYSDGITEQANPDDDMFGRERLEECLRGGGETELAMGLEQVESTVEEFARGVAASDDFTLLAVRRA